MNSAQASRIKHEVLPYTSSAIQKPTLGWTTAVYTALQEFPPGAPRGPERRSIGLEEEEEYSFKNNQRVLTFWGRVGRYSLSLVSINFVQFVIVYAMV